MTLSLCMIVGLLVAPALGISLEGKCPSTEVSYTTSANAAGTAEWTATKGGPDACHEMPSAKIKAFKLCGPGTLSISRMSCQRHEYKAEVIEHPNDVYTEGNCKVYESADTNVDGFVGSWQFSCATTAR